MTIVEVLVGAGVTGLVMLALLTGSILIQKQFGTSTRFADAQSDQLRVMDFIEMDLRRATAVTITSGATPLTLTRPNYYQTVNGRKQARLPTKSGLKVQYDTTSVTTTYTLQGKKLIRTEGGVATTIATSVQSFPPPVRTGKYVTTTLAFSAPWKARTETVTLSSKCLLRNLN
jgi:hypothetical protein